MFRRLVCSGVSTFWGLVAGLSSRRLGIDPRSVHVRFVVDGVTLGQVLSHYFRFLLLRSSRPTLHIAIYHRRHVTYVNRQRRYASHTYQYDINTDTNTNVCVTSHSHYTDV